MQTKFLMCPPDYYEIAYEINPWMSVRRNVNAPLARTQWDLLYKLLTDQIGVQVDLVPPVKGLPDMVFTANAGIVDSGIYIRSNFRHRERQPEAAFFEKWFQEHNYKIVTLPKVYSFEGEGDALMVGDTLYCGYHFRSDIQTHQIISEILNKRTLSIELNDDRFYHLDTCFCPLNENTVLYYNNAFDDYGLKVLRENIKNNIVVRLDEALHFVCNSIVIGKKIVCPSKCRKTTEMLRLLGYQVYQVDLSEFLKAGGSAKCLVLTVSRD